MNQASIQNRQTDDDDVQNPFLKQSDNQSNFSGENNELEKEGQFNDALDKAEKSLKVYPERYMMAVLYSLMCLAISLEQSMYVVISSSIVIMYDTSTFVVTANSLIHMLLHFPLSFPANYVVDKYGIKMGLIVAGVFLLIGSWVRCLVNVGGGSFGFSIVGAVCVGTANPFIINSLNKVSSNWFYPSQRPAVTAFLSFFSTVTGLAGIFIPGIWFSGFECEPGNCDIEEGKSKVFSLSVALACIETAFIIPNFLFFKAKPPTPPSFVDNVEREEFKVALKVLARDKIYILQAIVFAIFYGSFQDIATLLELICNAFGFTDSLEVAMLSAIPIFSGIAGCVISSSILKKTQQYKKTILACELGSIIALVLFGFLLYAGQYWLICIPAFVLGFFIIPMIPTMTEWTCETSYPIGEPTVTGFLWAIAHIFAGCAGFGFTALVEPDPVTKLQSQGNVTLMLAIIGALFGLAFLATFFINAPLKRLQAEKQRADQSSEQDTASEEKSYNS